MREKQRVREGERGVSAGGSVVGVGSLNSDQVGHSFRSRNCTVTISPSLDFASRHWRLSVEREGKRHFIFLDEDQLVWLVDVLAVAAKVNWKLPLECFRRSTRRTISLVTFWKNGVRFLCLRERCRDGKVFFVNIPSDWNSLGWKLLLMGVSAFGQRASEGVSKTFASLERSKSSLSFAQAVAGPRSTLEGDCRLEEVAGGVEVQVGELGVSQRLSWLARCLVFRLERVNATVPDWAGFRGWIVRRWGVDKGTEFRLLGDNLWLMELSSAEEVDRVIRLDRWNFPNHKISADRWIKGAGTSKVLEDRGWEWFRVVGVPLHLRSEALFNSISLAFGESAVTDVFGCNLNEVRVRVPSPRKAPDTVVLRYTEECFHLKVLKEVRLSPSLQLAALPVVSSEVSRQEVGATGWPEEELVVVPAEKESPAMASSGRAKSRLVGGKLSDGVLGNDGLDKRDCSELLSCFWGRPPLISHRVKVLGLEANVAFSNSVRGEVAVGPKSMIGPLVHSDEALKNYEKEVGGEGFGLEELFRQADDMRALALSSEVSESRRVIESERDGEAVENFISGVSTEVPVREESDDLVSRCQAMSDLFQLELNGSRKEASERVSEDGWRVERYGRLDVGILSEEVDVNFQITAGTRLAAAQVF
ncbi:hypothetical protein LINPERHAP2_LOCUS38070 [Linum perenne]